MRKRWFKITINYVDDTMEEWNKRLEDFTEALTYMTFWQNKRGKRIESIKVERLRNES